jgi:Zn-dependent M28 family amino/carboxypeptidase
MNSRRSEAREMKSPPTDQEFEKQKVMDNLYQHVEMLSVKIGERHLWKEGSLHKSEEYIGSALGSYGYATGRQTYSCYGKSVSNLIAEKTGSDPGTIVVGAHYDTVPGTPGADDNASGLAGLLELARLHQVIQSRKTIVFVAFVNEEPPCFGSSHMGSMVYANYIKIHRIPLEVMISLEMIGYFRQERIQKYPLPGMGICYPKTGDYIGVVGNFRSSRYVSFIKKGIRKHSNIRTRALTAPEFFGGINLSDNYSFWHHGYRAVMVTDTSFFRNTNYHLETDTIDTLNFDKMAEVVKGLHDTLIALCQPTQ